MHHRRNTLFLLMALAALLALAACQAQSPAATSVPPEASVQSPTLSSFTATLPAQTSQPASAQTASSPTAPAQTAAAQDTSTQAAPAQTASAQTTATQTLTAAGKAGAGCTVVSYQPVLRQSGQSLIPPGSDKDWIQGPKNAPITLLEYSDFQ